MTPPASPKSDDEDFESAFRFYLVVFGGGSIGSPDRKSLEGVGGSMTRTVTYYPVAGDV